MDNPLREKLRLKQLTPDHLEQFNELLRYVFQVTEDEIISSGYDDSTDIEKAKKPVLEKANVYGWFRGEDLVSQVAVYPFEVNIHGRLVKMGGITGVGTYPEYANMGLTKDLIKYALQAMREEGQVISYLYPYSIPFYRKKGWEIISDQITFTIKDTQLPKKADVSGYVERLDIDHPDVLSVYDRFAYQNHGAMIRTQLGWEEYWRWDNEEDFYAAVYYNESEDPIGLCFYKIVEETFIIKEMVFLNQEARKGLWNFIGNHFSMIENVKGYNYTGEPIAFMLEDSEIEEVIKPYYMARIVDVEGFLKSYTFVDRDQAFHFVIEDEGAPWNNGVFGVDWDDEDNVIISREAVGYPIKMDIQTLTALLMGYRSVSYFAKMGRIVADRRSLRILKRIIMQDRPYFSDYF